MIGEALLSYVSRRCLDKAYIQNKCKLKQNSFCIPLYTFDGQHGWQERFINPKENDAKSKTEYGSTGRYFLNGRDSNKDTILIVEGEIDFLSIIPYAEDYNLIGLKGINNLPHCIRDIETLKKIYDVYLLVDNDMAAEEYIRKIPYTKLHLYDVRDALCGHKDVNDAICANELNMKVFPKRIPKLKPKPKKQFSRNETLDTLEKIDNIPVIDVLENLYPEYRRRGQESIAENGKETHGYKYSRSLNIIKDFSGKGRPEGGPFQIAKAKFGEAKLAFLYFKGKI